MSHPAGHLYVVATPIGNLEDLSARARRVLGKVDLIAAEDTRHSRKLLQYLGLHTRMLSLHQHNESAQTAELLEMLRRGRNIALISDAGTPLLSDPGFELVRAARTDGLPVYAVPGPSALVAALSVAGLPADRFIFEGFLPHKSVARRKLLECFQHEVRTAVCFESSHRVAEAIDDIVEVLGPERRMAIARELTKIHEQVVSGSAAEMRDWLKEPNHCLGEFVLLIAGLPEVRDPDQAMISVDALLKTLLSSLSVSESARVAADLTGLKKNALYDRALQLQSEMPTSQTKSPGDC